MCRKAVNRSNFIHERLSFHMHCETVVGDRLYGENTRDIINGLKLNPAAAVPVVLKRLISKEKEWRDAQKEFNRIWREQSDRFFLKSLDHQATKFKQCDVKRIRSKSLLREIEIVAEQVSEYECLWCLSRMPDQDKQITHKHVMLLCCWFLNLQVFKVKVGICWVETVSFRLTSCIQVWCRLLVCNYLILSQLYVKFIMSISREVWFKCCVISSQPKLIPIGQYWGN